MLKLPQKINFSPRVNSSNNYIYNLLAPCLEAMLTHMQGIWHFIVLFQLPNLKCLPILRKNIYDTLLNSNIKNLKSSSSKLILNFSTTQFKNFWHTAPGSWRGKTETLHPLVILLEQMRMHRIFILRYMAILKIEIPWCRSNNNYFINIKFLKL